MSDWAAGQDPTRQRLLETAGPLFAEKGFEATSVRDITDRAGTSPAAVSYHFRSKEHLYIETVRHAAQSCAAATPMPVWPDGVAPQQRLRDFIGAFLRRLLSPEVPAWHRVLIMREVAQPRPGICEEFVRDFVRPTFNILMGILRELVGTDVPVAQLRLLGSSIVGQCLHYHHARHIIPLLVGPEESSRYSIDVLTEHIHRFSLAALRGLFPDRSGGGRA
jgi:AcrR family transcriptional regulator